MIFPTSSLKSIKTYSATICAIASLTFSGLSLAHEHNNALSFKTTEISPGIYMISGQGGFTGGNIGLSVGEDGVAMIDNGVSKVIGILREEISKTTNKPIDYLINTHLHGDHIGNNSEFSKDGAQIVSHQNLRASLVKENKDKASLPILTFSDQMTIHINGDAAKVIHVKNAHTDGDAFIHFEKANIIHTGDIMFNGRFPFIDGKNGGTLKGVIGALEKISSMSDNNTKIIPGHGPLASKKEVEKTIAMLKDAKQLVADLVNKGKSDDEVLQANPLSKYQSYSWGFINTEKMTKQILANVR